MSASQRRKGATWEQTVAQWLTAHGVPARRNTIGTANDDLLHDHPWFSFEAKDHVTYKLAEWVAQAEAQAGEKVGVVVAHRNGKASVDDAYFVMSGRMFARLLAMSRDEVALPSPG